MALFTLSAPPPALIALGVIAIVAVLGMGFAGSNKLDLRAERLGDSTTPSAAEKAEAAGSTRKRLQELTAMLVKRATSFIGLHDKFDEFMERAGIRSPYAQLYFVTSKFGGLFASSGLMYLNFSVSFQFVLNPTRSYALTALVGIAAFFLPDLLIKNRRVKRQQQVRRHWQDTLDLLIICVESGLSIEHAMRRVTQEIATVAPIVAEELVITMAELSFQPDRRQAYANLAARIDLPAVKATTIALIQAEKQGAAIGKSLRTISIANREDLINAAEQKAASLGPKLTVPMIVFFLPVLFVIIIAPMFLNSSL